MQGLGSSVLFEPGEISKQTHSIRENMKDLIQRSKLTDRKDEKRRGNPSRRLKIARWGVNISTLWGRGKLSGHTASGQRGHRDSRDNVSGLKHGKGRMWRAVGPELRRRARRSITCCDRAVTKLTAPARAPWLAQIRTIEHTHAVEITRSRDRDLSRSRAISAYVRLRTPAARCPRAARAASPAEIVRAIVHTGLASRGRSRLRVRCARRGLCVACVRRARPT
eukprot:4080661-Pleurochrysis_carterae.AAC.1